MWIRLFSEEQVDQHINYYEEHYRIKIRRTKSDIPDKCTFTEQEIEDFNANLALRMVTQPRVTRKPLLQKWINQPIEYPKEPHDMGNMKYRHLLLYHGFTTDLKAELKKTLKTNARLNQHMLYMRESFTIGNQRGKRNYGKHKTPNRFPELSYWPKLHLFEEEKDKGMSTLTHGATPAADPSAIPVNDPRATPAGQAPSGIPPLLTPK